MNQEIDQKRNLQRYTANLNQILGTKEYRLSGGKMDGVRCVDVRNGSGLEFTVVPDRGMDITSLSFKGINFGFLTSNGITSPHYCSEDQIGFVRNFIAGFLTTCGLLNVGDYCEDDGEKLVAHGRISCMPAEEVYAGTEYKNNDIILRVKGKIKETRFLGENLELDRNIVCKYEENKIVITDSFSNNGFTKQSFMLLYHFNTGYPLLSDDAKVYIPSDRILLRGNEQRDNLYSCQINSPTKNYQSQVFYHDMHYSEDGRTFACVFNTKYKLGFAIWYHKNHLNRFSQWNCFNEGEYVMGLEPCNCHVDGRTSEKKYNTLQYIEPNEIKEVCIEIEIIESIERLHEITRSVNP